MKRHLMEFYEIDVKHDLASQKRSDMEAGSSIFESADSSEFNASNDDTEDEISDNVDQPFICGHCVKEFSVKINLDAHTSRIHLNQR